MGQVWDSFDIRKKAFWNYDQRFNSYEYPEIRTQEDYSISSITKTPGTFAFDFVLASDCGSFPVPSAHFATRES